MWVQYRLTGKTAHCSAGLAIRGRQKRARQNRQLWNSPPSARTPTYQEKEKKCPPATRAGESVQDAGAEWPDIGANTQESRESVSFPSTSPRWNGHAQVAAGSPLDHEDTKTTRMWWESAGGRRLATGTVYLEALTEQLNTPEKRALLKVQAAAQGCQVRH